MTKEELFSVKAEVLTSGLYRKVMLANRVNFFEGDRSQKNALEAVYGVEKVKIATNLYNSRYKRSQRVESHISMMLQLPNCEWVFATLTFSDETLKSTSFQTRRKYVSRWCKEVSAIYVANVDYGEDNGREHYHAVLCNIVSKEAKAKWDKYGFSFFEKIRVKKSKNPTLAVSRYITKLTAHALKETASRGLTRVIYSKRLRIDFSQEF